MPGTRLRKTCVEGGATTSHEGCTLAHSEIDMFATFARIAAVPRNATRATLRKAKQFQEFASTDNFGSGLGCCARLCHHRSLSRLGKWCGSTSAKRGGRSATFPNAVPFFIVMGMSHENDEFVPGKNTTGRASPYAAC
jgi:hypothetical protein